MLVEQLRINCKKRCRQKNQCSMFVYGTMSPAFKNAMQQVYALGG